MGPAREAELADDQEDWIPLREAVTEVAKAYAPFMFCDPAGSLETAQLAVLRSLHFGLAASRAPKWILTFHEREGDPGTREDQLSGVEIPLYFWGVYQNAETVVAEDWIAGHYSFSWNGNHSTTPPEEPAPEDGVYAFGMAVGVEVTRRGLPLIGDGNFAGMLAEAGGDVPRLMRETRGRTRKWDWEGAMCAVIAQANTPDGLPEGYGAQAEVGRLIGQWFRDNQRGEPAPSEIGARAAKVMAAIEASRK